MQRYALFLNMQGVDSFDQIIKRIISVGYRYVVPCRLYLIGGELSGAVSECDKLSAVERGRIPEVKVRVKPLGILRSRAMQCYVGSQPLQA